MRIAIDAMGGDNAPDAIVAGALEAVDLLDPTDELLLVGPEQILTPYITKKKKIRDRVHIIDAPDAIGMDESPVDSLRKKPKSSIAILAKLAKQGQADAVISAGNTGACVAAFQMRMRTLDGVNRPGIAIVLPTFEGPVTICDVGANIACKPINLLQYGLMSSIYTENILGIEKPRVGLLSIGEEDAKGNEVVKKTRDLMKNDTTLNFIGNIEGRDIFKGVCDVVVCEGFVGNVILKMCEGLVEGLFRSIKHELMQEKLHLALKFKPVMKRIYKKYDHHEYGGAPLLGINGTAMICHGSSEDHTIRNAVQTARRYHEKRINKLIIDSLSQTNTRTADAESK